MEDNRFSKMNNDDNGILKAAGNEKNGMNDFLG